MRRTKRTVAGSAGAAVPGSGAANGSSPEYWRSAMNSTTLSPSVCASQPNRNTALTLPSVSGVAGPKPSAAAMRVNSAPVRPHAAHRAGWWASSSWLVSVR